MVYPLIVEGANFGSNAVWYTAAESGIVTTTIEFTMVGNTLIQAEDSWFPLDVSGGLAVIEVEIPEFPTLLIPLLCAAAVVALRRRKSG